MSIIAHLYVALSARLFQNVSLSFAQSEYLHIILSEVPKNLLEGRSLVTFFPCFTIGRLDMSNRVFCDGSSWNIELWSQSIKLCSFFFLFSFFCVLFSDGPMLMVTKVLLTNVSGHFLNIWGSWWGVPNPSSQLIFRTNPSIFLHPQSIFGYSPNPSKF